MPTVASILAELKKKGSRKTREIYARHGMATNNMFGVSAADLKVIAKTIRKQQTLACSSSTPGISMPCIWREWSLTVPK